MTLEILVVGGSLNVPGRANAPFSTTLLLKDDERIILVDPGSFVTTAILEEELTKRRISPDDVTDIILTHVHMDHIYNSIFFKNATIHLHESYKTKDYEKFGPLIGKLYKSVIESWRKLNFIDDGETLFNYIHAYHTPWHAREHLSFVIESSNMGKVFFPGDICYTRLDYYDIIKGNREGKSAEFIKERVKECNVIIFTHDLPLNLR
ncbi:MAG: MBL fold metallo-hydrolase [Thermotogae bacterium]|nr:MAG: MBL fold metallo-hydrolase [Thermotogota bacterium]